MVIDQMEKLLESMRVEYANATPEKKAEIAERAKHIKTAKELLKRYQERNDLIKDIVREQLESVPVEEVEDIFIKN